jgi:nitroreductase
MEAIDMLKLRRSVRVYQDKPIPKDVIEKIIDAARFAPTARNEQPWAFVVTTKSEIIRRIAGLGPNANFASGAKACIVVFALDTKYYLEDGCSATVNILNAAAAFGVGSCWIAGDKKDYCEEVRNMFAVPAGYKLVSLISLGYPEDKNSFKLMEKRALDKVLHWENF